MAKKIEDYLKAILEARYGEDVRNSIHDAIEMINKIAGIKFGTDITSTTSPSGDYEIGTFYINNETDDMWKMAGTDLWEHVGNIKGEPGTPGTDAPKPYEVVEISHVGLIRTYELRFDDGSAFPFIVKDGESGSGTGDMTKAVYDTDNDGIVDQAEKVGNAITAILEKFDEDLSGNLLYDGRPIGGTVSIDNDTITKNAKDELQVAESLTAKLAIQIPSASISGDTVTFSDARIGSSDMWLASVYCSDLERYMKSRSVSGNTLTVVYDSSVVGTTCVLQLYKEGV